VPAEVEEAIVEFLRRHADATGTLLEVEPHELVQVLVARSDDDPRAGLFRSPDRDRAQVRLDRELASGVEPQVLLDPGLRQGGSAGQQDHRSARQGGLREALLHGVPPSPGR
jgi:hypothetical protein